MNAKALFGGLIAVLLCLGLVMMFIAPLFEDDADCRRTTHVYDDPNEIEHISFSSGHVTHYDYENMSSDAQSIFDRAREDGDYQFYDASDDPPEFEYSDEAQFYTVSYRNDTYYLWTGGCSA